MSLLTKEQEERLACVLHGHYTRHEHHATDRGSRCPVCRGKDDRDDKQDLELLLRRCRKALLGVSYWRHATSESARKEARLTIEVIDEQLLKL